MEYEIKVLDEKEINLLEAIVYMANGGFCQCKEKRRNLYRCKDGKIEFFHNTKWEESLAMFDNRAKFKKISLTKIKDEPKEKEKVSFAKAIEEMRKGKIMVSPNCVKHKNDDGSIVYQAPSGEWKNFGSWIHIEINNKWTYADESQAEENKPLSLHDKLKIKVDELNKRKEENRKNLKPFLKEWWVHTKSLGIGSIAGIDGGIIQMSNGTSYTKEEFKNYFRLATVEEFNKHFEGME